DQRRRKKAIRRNMVLGQPNARKSEPVRLLDLAQRLRVIGAIPPDDAEAAAESRAGRRSSVEVRGRVRPRGSPKIPLCCSASRAPQKRDESPRTEGPPD